MARYIPLTLGTVATPRNPTGRRAVFYRDKTGQHWPLRELALAKVGRKPIEMTAALTSPAAYRDLVGNVDKTLAPFNPASHRGFPVPARRELYDASTQALSSVVDNPFRTLMRVEWGRTLQVSSFRVKREDRSGTVFFERFAQATTPA